MVTGNLSPLLLAGVFYLVITVPLTHFVNAIDSLLRVGKRRPSQVTSRLEEVSELDAVAHLKTEMGLSERRACQIISADRDLNPSNWTSFG